MKTFRLSASAPVRVPPARDVVFDGFCEVCGVLPAELTRSARGALNQAISEVRAVNSQLTIGEIRRRAERYHRIYPNAALTPMALARHWAECWPGHREPAALPPTDPILPEPPGDWRELIADHEWLQTVANRDWASIPYSCQSAIYRTLNRS